MAKKKNKTKKSSISSSKSSKKDGKDKKRKQAKILDTCTHTSLSDEKDGDNNKNECNLKRQKVHGNENGGNGGNDATADIDIDIDDTEHKKTSFKMEHGDDGSDDGGDGNGRVTKEKLLKKEKKEKKRMKKEKKKQKRKADDNDEENDDNSGSDSKKKNEKKKKKKKRKKNHEADEEVVPAVESESTSCKENLKSRPTPQDITAAPNEDDLQIVGGRIVSYSASIVNETDVNVAEKQKQKEKEKTTKAAYNDNENLEKENSGGDSSSNGDDSGDSNNNITLLLFYQYIEPMLNETEFQHLFNHIETTGEKYSICGRARVATEGLNCTLTGSYENIRQWCKSLRSYDGNDINININDDNSENGIHNGIHSNNKKYFRNTEFKLTDDLPMGQAFKNFHAFRVDEIVNYGLAGERAPAVSMSGVHLEPKDYHKKMTEGDTVIIDVRNHYEAAIGKFNPPSGGAEYIDPFMRKSTEFPVWLDRPETKKMLEGKQVLMYCTGGIRCERASALLRTKIENEEDTKKLGIKGVYQLQGGIDKYFRDFPEGGWWRGKNYVFDKRFAHAPPVVENLERQQKSQDVLGKCEACQKPWDRYRGKKRCPTCGVPLLICRQCCDADKEKTKKLAKNVKCDLCVKEGITSKRELRQKEQKEMADYEKKLRKKYGFKEINPSKKNSSAATNNPTKKTKIVPNPNKITRLFIKNLNIKTVDQPQLCDLVEGITHIEWILDRQTKEWYGAVFVEVSTPENAAKAVGSIHKQKIHGRVVHCSFNKPDPKSIWPPPNTKI